jgi:hypothetical protein
MDPVTFTRIDANNYRVARIHITRVATNRWIAGPADGGRAMFEDDTLEGILELAHQAVEMFRSVEGVEA